MHMEPREPEAGRGSDLVREGVLREASLKQDLRPGGHLLEHHGGTLPAGWTSEQAGG